METRINLDDLFAEALQELQDAKQAHYDAELRIAFARGRLAQLRVIQQKIEEGSDAQTSNPADIDIMPAAVACPCAG